MNAALITGTAGVPPANVGPNASLIYSHILAERSRLKRAGRTPAVPVRIVGLFHVPAKELDNLRVHAQPVVQLHKAVTFVFKQYVLDRPVVFL